MKKILALLISSILFSSFSLNSQTSFTIAPNICTGDTTYLTANTGSLSNCTYTWLSIPSGANLSSTNSSVTGLSFQSSGMYTIVLNVTSASATTSFQNSITAISLPTITLAQNSLTTCIASNFPLFSKPIHLTATGAISYTWNPPPLPSMTGNPNGPTNDVRPPANTCFSVTGQNSNGCKSKSSICVTVLPRYSITVVPANTIMCQNNLNGPGYTTELIAGNPSSPIYGASSSHSYSWTQPPMGSILTPAFSATVVVAPFTTTTYTVEMTDSLNCVSLPAITTVSVQNCNGIEYSSVSPNLRFYPNPFIDKLYLSCSVFFPAHIHLSFFNSMGLLLYDLTVLSKDQELDVSSLPVGIYYLKIESEGHLYSYKIIKTN